MSKIYTKTQREAYLVTKSVAEGILKDLNDENVPPQTMMTIKHIEGTKMTTKADIRSIDVSYSDKDYWERKNELDPPKPFTPEIKKQTPEEEQRSKEAMLRAKENLRKAGIIK